MKLQHFILAVCLIFVFSATSVFAGKNFDSEVIYFDEVTLSAAVDSLPSTPVDLNPKGGAALTSTVWSVYAKTLNDSCVVVIEGSETGTAGSWMSVSTAQKLTGAGQDSVLVFNLNLSTEYQRVKIFDATSGDKFIIGGMGYIHKNTDDNL